MPGGVTHATDPPALARPGTQAATEATAVGESAAEKVQLMRECGVKIVKLPSDFGTTVPKVLRR